MKIEDLKYTLRPENITSVPRDIRLGRRDLGRMIVIDRKNKVQIDSFVLDLPNFFSKGDVLVLNNSKRVPGILKGVLHHNNAQVELQFVSLSREKNALCRIYPMHHISIGQFIDFEGDQLLIVGKDIGPNRLCEVAAMDRPLAELLKDKGYPINAFFSSRSWDVDHLNPFYSKVEGSIESPLAGLHFTPELLCKLEKKGVQIVYVTLHSIGSWLPFLEQNIDDHQVFEEEFEISELAASVIMSAMKKGNCITACGSTAMRAIESSTDETGNIIQGLNRTKLYIKPGYNFKIIDRYFTNFHQYRTSLMVLDAAFCGKELLMQSIEVAKERSYLFYEYGDAVFYI